MTQDAAPLPGYPEPYGLLAAILQDATAEWRGELWGETPGPEAITWQPRPKGPSIGGILLHMTIAELFWFEQFALGQEIGAEDKLLLMWDEIDVDTGEWPKPPEQPLSWYFHLQDRFRARTLEAIKSWPTDTLKETPWHPGRTVSLSWVLGHVIQHEAYHGGQIILLYDLWKRHAAGN